MRPRLVVVLSPCFDRGLCIDQARKVVLVQAFISKFTVEAFDESILHRLARLNERERDSVPMCPEVERLSLELGTVVTNDSRGKSALSQRAGHECEPPVPPEASDRLRWPDIPW